MKLRSKIKKSEYKRYVVDMSELLFYLIDKNKHPTQFLCDVIEEVYGHKVKLKDMIKLIETSKLG